MIMGTMVGSFGGYRATHVSLFNCHLWHRNQQLYFLEGETGAERLNDLFESQASTWRWLQGPRTAQPCFMPGLEPSVYPVGQAGLPHLILVTGGKVS